MSRSCATELACVICGRTYAPSGDRLGCDCGGWLLQQYDISRASAAGKPTGVIRTLWRYASMLPVQDESNIISLGEGGTPLVALNRLSRRLKCRVLVKDEGRGPTGSFKCRGASVGVSRLVELGRRRLGMPSVGSGGSAWSAYGARAGIEVEVGLPAFPEIPSIARVEPPLYGAKLSFHDGPDVPAAFSGFGASLGEGVANVGGFVEPYRIEGEKTIAYEICEELGWVVPQTIIWPAGGAPGFVALAKGLTELRDLGWTDQNRTNLVAAQYADSAPLAHALEHGDSDTDVFRYAAENIATGVGVNRLKLGSSIIAYLRSAADTYGVTSNNVGIMETMIQVAQEEGLLLSPEGALTVHSVAGLRESGRVREGSTVVCINSANALRYPHILEQLRPSSVARSPSLS
jgi:threonine synthase